MNKKCEICKDESDMEFNMAAPPGATFKPEVSNNPNMFTSDICLNCWGKHGSDEGVLLAIVAIRKESS